MTFNFSKKSLNRLQGVHPDLVRLCKEVIKVSPIDFGIAQGVRTMQEQRELYAQGRTKPGPIVTWTLDSDHLIQKDGYGHAIDFACYIGDQLTWAEKYYDEVSDVFQKKADELGLKIDRGSTWKRKDRPHIAIP